MAHPIRPLHTIPAGEVKTNPTLGRPNVFDVDLGAVAENTRHVRAAVGKDVLIYVAVKSNGYGYGLIEISKTVLRNGADGLTMADIRGAVRLREHGVDAPILLYAGAPAVPGTVEAVAAHDLNPTVVDLDSAKEFSRLAPKPVDVFVKVSLGLERVGVAPRSVVRFVQEVGSMRNLRVHGLYTHLHIVAGPDASPYAEAQFDQFAEVLADLRQLGITPPVTMAASSNVLALTSSMLLNAVDPGRLVYGLPTTHPHGIAVRPAFRSLSTQLIQVRPLERESWRSVAPFDLSGVDRVGVIPMGRSEGLVALNVGHVLVHGRRAQILGAISLEHTRVDLTAIPDARIGDEVVVIGEQGHDRISLDEVAEHQNTSLTYLALEVRESVRRRYLSET
jgi:alanine racemase